MKKFIKPLSLIFCLICFSGMAFAQNADLNFVSKEGRFTIGLPAGSVKQSSVDMGSGFSAMATEFNWNVAEGFFILTYADLTKEVENPKDFLNLVSQSLVNEMTSSGGKLISEKEFMLEENHGREVIIQLKGGDTIGIGRYYIVKKRVYTLFSGWKKGENGDTQKKVLDSFKLLNPNLIVKPVVN